MKKRINLLNTLLIAFFLLLTFNLNAQVDPGTNFDLQDYINTRINQGQTTITVPPGRYRVEAGEFSHLNFVDRNNITIIADGVEMICTNTVRAIYLYRCNNFKIQGLSIDYDPLPYTQAQITNLSGDKKTITASIISGYSSTLTDGKMQTYNTNGDLVVPEYYEAGYNLNGQTLTITKSTTDGDEQVGDIFVMANNGTKRVDHAIYADDCTYLTLDNVTLYSGPTFGFFETNCVSSKYNNCKIDRRPLATDIKARGIKRMRSVDADGFHSKHGFNPSYVGCTARYNADDGIAINGDFHVVLGSSGNQLTVVGKNGDAPNLEAGDPVELVSYTGERIPDATITNIYVSRGLNGTEKDFLNDQGFIGDATGTPDASNVYIVVLDRSVSLPMGSLINDANLVGNNFEIRNCTIGPNRSRGVLVKASHGDITNNTFTDNWGKAIKVAPEYKWLEAGSSSDINITDNTITACRDVAIGVYAAGGDGQTPPAGAHDDIVIMGNTITGSTNPGIAVTSTTNLCEKNNSITSPNNALLPEYKAFDFGRDTDPNETIYLESVVETSCDNSGNIDIRTLSVNPTNIFISPSEQIQLESTITPGNATNQNITWSSQNNSIATVNPSSGLITGIANGTTNIIATSIDDPSITASCSVEVGDPVDEITITTAPDIVVPSSTVQVTISYSATEESRIFTILQNNSTYDAVNQDIRIVQAGTGSFTVDFVIDPELTNGIDTHQWVTYITSAPDGGFDDNRAIDYNWDIDVDDTAVRVNVSPTNAFISNTEQIQLEAEVLNTTNKNVTWSSENTSIATVDSNGLVTAQANGTTNIVATSNADSNQTASCSIEVGDPIDEIRILDAPEIITPGSTIQVNVSYSATQNRRIFTYLQDKETFDWDLQDIRTVNAGTGSFTIDFNVDSNLPIGVDTHDWVCYITTSPDGGWDQKLLEPTNIYNVDVDNSSVIINLNSTSEVLVASATFQLEANVLNATNQSVTWSSENSAVATVSNSGLITAISDGTTNIIATSNEDNTVTASCSITVGELTDAISSVDGPNGVSQGNAVTVSVNYSSTKTQDIVVFLQTTDSYELASDWVVTTVGAGVSSIDASVTPLSTLANGSAYRWVAQILETSPLIDGFDDPVTVDPDLSVSDYDVKLNLKVFPNPTKGTLNINLENSNNQINADLIDLSGRVLMSRRLNSNSNSLDLSNLSNGVYLLHVKEGGKISQINKVIVNH